MGPFHEIVAILGIAAILGALGLFLRQPLIVAFLATGILVGPSGFSIVQSSDQVDLLARIGISLLLFVVGLRLDLHLIRTTGPVALATGIGQVLFTSLFGFFIVLALGFSVIPALYIAVALTFSSTIIIVKLLSDKKELGSLHGRIAIGFLIVQDIVAILAMIMLTAVGGGSGEENVALYRIVLIALKGLAFLACMGLLMRYVLPGVARRLAVNQELLVLSAIAWAVFVGAVGDYLGFSKEVGAFLAGVSLASTPYRDAIAARLVSVRDFLLLFFFIDLGARLKLDMVGPQLANSIYLSLFVLVGNPIIVLAIMGYMGYRRRTGFMAGLTVAQISEFSLILGALGVSLGHISMEAMSLITLVGVITICISTYMIIYSSAVYRWISAPLRVFERSHPYREQTAPETCSVPEVDSILIGLGNYGSSIAEHLLERKRRLVGVDFDPQALAVWRTRGIPVIFGDVGDPEFFDILPLHCSAWVVSTVRDRQLNLTLLHILKERGFEGKIAIAAQDEEEAKAYQERGADVVLRPFSDAAEEAADSLTETMHLLPSGIDWPLTLEEIKLRKGSVFAGQLIRDLDLRKLTGITIVAVSRAGRVYLNPDPEFQLFPADRLVLMGDPETIRMAEDFLQQLPEEEPDQETRRFAMAEVEVHEQTEGRGKTLEEIRFRDRHGATVIGIVRKHERIMMPRPHERLQPGDRLIVIGAPESVERLRKTFAVHASVQSGAIGT
jgi:Kef-type K+ transport system membrane component KefB/Trk K+ transport system NAD-binding subunit